METAVGDISTPANSRVESVEGSFDEDGDDELLDLPVLIHREFRQDVSDQVRNDMLSSGEAAAASDGIDVAVYRKKMKQLLYDAKKNTMLNFFTASRGAAPEALTPHQKRKRLQEPPTSSDPRQSEAYEDEKERNSNFSRSQLLKIRKESLAVAYDAVDRVEKKREYLVAMHEANAAVAKVIDAAAKASVGPNVNLAMIPDSEGSDNARLLDTTAAIFSTIVRKLKQIDDLDGEASKLNGTLLGAIQRASLLITSGVPALREDAEEEQREFDAAMAAVAGYIVDNEIEVLNSDVLPKNFSNLRQSSGDVLGAKRRKDEKSSAMKPKDAMEMWVDGLVMGLMQLREGALSYIDIDSINERVATRILYALDKMLNAKAYCIIKASDKIKPNSIKDRLEMVALRHPFSLQIDATTAALRARRRGGPVQFGSDLSSVACLQAPGKSH